MSNLPEYYIHIIYLYHCVTGKIPRACRLERGKNIMVTLQVCSRIDV